MRTLTRIIGLALLAGLVPSRVGGQSAAIVVEPETLTKRADLLGRAIEVDDRIGRFQYHPNGGFDELYLKRAPDVTFTLPERIRPPHNPTEVAVRVRGVLQRVEGRYVCSVSSFDALPADIDRLNRGIALLGKSDTDGRMAWVRWAEARAEAFLALNPKAPDPTDEALLARARQIEAEVLRVEADRPARDPAAHWLALAERARSRNIPEPEPSALAHRGFRAALQNAKTADALKTLLTRIEAFFPKAATPLEHPIDLSAWQDSYKSAPADAYRLARVEVRAGLTRRLWADTAQLWLERQAGDADPKGLIRLAEDAANLLPDRPALTTAILEKGLGRAAENVGALRRAEVQELAELYRVKLNQPEKARALDRAWLDDQRTRLLSPRDAEGRLALAESYETLLDDKLTAIALIREAWAIDPRSKEVTAAFRQRGFRKVGDDWVGKSQPGRNETGVSGVERKENVGAEGPTVANSAGPAVDASPVLTSNSLRGATPDQVRGRLSGPPNRRIYAASQGQVVEQWVFYQPSRTIYINFRHRPGESTPRVFAHYSLPRSRTDPSPPP